MISPTLFVITFKLSLIKTDVPGLLPGNVRAGFLITSNTALGDMMPLACIWSSAWPVNFVPLIVVGEFLVTTFRIFLLLPTGVLANLVSNLATLPTPLKYLYVFTTAAPNTSPLAHQANISKLGSYNAGLTYLVPCP